MNFGEALEALKQGKRVYRKGWNGKNMYIKLQKGTLPCQSVDDLYDHLDLKRMSEADCIITHIENIPVELFKGDEDEQELILPNLLMVTKTGSLMNGWTPNILDILVEDWEILK